MYIPQNQYNNPYAVADYIRCSVRQPVPCTLITAVVIGGLFGILLYMTSSYHFYKNETVRKIIGLVLNIIRSVLFLILMILFLPLSKIIVGTKIGPEAVVVPLLVASVAFFARLAEASFSDVNNGIIEAAFSSGASKSRIIFSILISEALPSIIRILRLQQFQCLDFLQWLNLSVAEDLATLLIDTAIRDIRPIL
ncbi:MAG: ABC transporter permease subunit [Ruminococcus sp.]|nr:ABC transporter permease subunit [Ruminococcus sp.]